MSDNAPLIEIVVDGGAGLGYGHISRMRTLSQTLLEDGFAVRFAPQSSVAREALSDRADSPRSGPPDLTLIDLPYDGSKWAGEAKAAGRPVAALDYTGSEEIDLSIRTNAPAERPAARREVHGLDYAIIRLEVRDVVPESAEHVLVSIGGSDLGDRGPQAAARLAEAGQSVILVRGPLAGPLEDAPAGVDVRLNPPELPLMMASCAWAVANAGTTLMELMHLGKAVHVLPQTREEERFASDLLSQGAILGAGLDMLAPPDPGRQAQIAMKAASLVDGQGVKRISALCAELVGKETAR